MQMKSSRKTTCCSGLGLTVLLVFMMFSISTAMGVTPKLNADGYYEIDSAEGLKWFAEQVNSGNSSINGKLTASIHLKYLKEDVWTPIGSIDTNSATYHKFTGIFDGDGCTIYDLVLPKQSGSGLFGYVDGATIKDIQIDGVKVSTEFTSSYLSEGLGALVGIANNSTISECSTWNAAITVTADADYQAIDAVGGIVGICYNHSTIEDCYFQSGYVMTNTKYVGSIVGAAQISTIKDCHVGSSSTGVTKICGGD